MQNLKKKNRKSYYKMQEVKSKTLSGKSPGQPQASPRRRQLLQRFSMSPDLTQLSEVRRSIELVPTEGMPFSEASYDAITYRGEVFVFASKDDVSLCASRDNVFLCTIRERVLGQGMVNKTVVCCEISETIDKQISNAFQLNRHLQVKQDTGFELSEEERSAKVSTTASIGKFQREVIEKVRVLFGRDVKIQFAVWDPMSNEYVEWYWGFPSENYLQ